MDYLGFSCRIKRRGTRSTNSEVGDVVPLVIYVNLRTNPGRVTLATFRLGYVKETIVILIYCGHALYVMFLAREVDIDSGQILVRNE